MKKFIGQFSLSIIQIDPGTAKTASFIIYANSLGQVPINLQAQSYSAADALRRDLLVEVSLQDQNISQGHQRILGTELTTYIRSLVFPVSCIDENVLFVSA